MRSSSRRTWSDLTRHARDTGRYTRPGHPPTASTYVLSTPQPWAGAPNASSNPSRRAFRSSEPNRHSAPLTVWCGDSSRRSRAKALATAGRRRMHRAGEGVPPCASRHQVNRTARRGQTRARRAPTDRRPRRRTGSVRHRGRRARTRVFARCMAAPDTVTYRARPKRSGHGPSRRRRRPKRDTPPPPRRPPRTRGAGEGSATKAPASPRRSSSPSSPSR